MDTALPQKFPSILDRNLAKANCTENRVLVGNMYLNYMFEIPFPYHLTGIKTSELTFLTERVFRELYKHG